MTDSVNDKINTILPTLGDGKWRNESFVNPFDEFVMLLTHPDHGMELEANMANDPRDVEEIFAVFNGWLSRNA